MCNENEHDYFLASKSEEEYKKKLESDGFGVWTHFRKGTLICKRCGDIKYIELDVSKVQH